MAKNKTGNNERKYNRIRQVLEKQERTQTWLSEQLDLDFVTVTRDMSIIIASPPLQRCLILQGCLK